jgi:hypothetical protein
VLDAVARVLRLDDHERRHLYTLAGTLPPYEHTPIRHDVDPLLIRMLDTWMPNPAQLLDRHWYVVASNEAARFVFDSESPNFNALFCAFLNPMLRADPDLWTDVARAAVAGFRAEMSLHPDDPAFAAIAKELASISPDFAELWSGHDVRPPSSSHQVIGHPTAGQLTFDIGFLRAKTNPDILAALYFPAPNTGTEERLQAALSALST